MKKEINKRDEGHIAGKIVFSGTLTNTTPLLIGKGEGDESDVEVMLWTETRPYIPASSFAGALRRFYEKFEIGVGKPDEFEKFWGSKDANKKNTYQSHIVFHELLPGTDSEHSLTIRDGVRIEYTTGTAADMGKYDYQLVEPGAKFILNGEVTVRKDMDFDFFKQMTITIQNVIKHDDFRVGALTSFGFGKLELSKWKAFEFDFTSKAKGDGEKWFKYLERKVHGATPLDIKPFEIENQRKFEIKAQFKVKSAMIIGSYNSDPDLPDKSHLTSKGKPVLTAKTVKGAIRHRAVKILNTLDLGGNDQQTKDLFGWVNLPTDPKLYNRNRVETQALKSRLRIEEEELRDVKTMTQNRIKIDRFTGGVISGALFSSAPVWKNNEALTFSLHFTLRDYRNWEAALLLHILKDLWTEDLAIGGEKNIGRGILQGERAEIRWAGKEALIEKTDEGIIIRDNKDELITDFNEALETKSKKD